MKNSDAKDLISLAKRIPELDAEYAIGLAGGSGPLYEKTLRAVVRLLPSNISQMDGHIREGGNLGAFAVKAHGVKGSLNQIGYLRLAKLAEVLENAAKDGDRLYCERNYGGFREGLLQFYSLLSEEALREPEPDLPSGSCGETPFDAASRAREAVLEFDALKASDILSPLAGRCFDENANALILKAVEALAAFKYKQALACIDELMEPRGNPAASYAEEERL